MEAAIKLARQYFIEQGEPGRHRLISRRQSYHGNTLGALSTGGNAWRREPFAPLMIETSHISPCYEYRGRQDSETPEAYGLRDESLVREVGRQAFPGTELRPGMCFQTPGDAGPQIVSVVEVKGDSVVVDTNHPLAGETLSYRLEVLDIRQATRAELAKGHPLPPGTEASEVEDRKVL